METHELKTFLLKESGNFDKFDISATLKLSEEELNKEIRKIRKRRNMSVFAIVFLIILVFLNLISMKTGFLEGWLPDWNLIFIFALYDMWIFYNIGTQKKKEYVYQLLLKIDKQQDESIAA